MIKLFRCLAVLAAVGLAICATPAQAIPVLQLYIEGSTYDPTTESWLLTDDGTFRLWAIGNLDGPGGTGGNTINNARLSAAYAKADAGVQIVLMPSTTGGYGGFTDPSTPGTPTLLGTHIGGTPLLGDGKTSLPTHGVFGDNTGWREWLLGSFSVADSPIGDFIQGFPDPIPSADGRLAQINVYDVAVTFPSDATEEWVHFDLYDTVTSYTEVQHGRKKASSIKYTTVAYKAPFSHDATATGTIPEPASLVVWSVIGAGAGLGVIRRRRARWSEENRNEICQIIERGRHE
jgi:hypothetical protein